jgi:hypothetical protein
MQSYHNLRDKAASLRHTQTTRRRARMTARLTGKMPRRVCNGCRGDFQKDPGPVLIDWAWKRIAKFDEELLCHKCVVRRMGAPLMWYHILDCPWNTHFAMVFGLFDFMEPRCWWRGPSAFRVWCYGSYVYDREAMVRAAFADKTTMVDRDAIFLPEPEPGAPSVGYATGGTYRG